MAYRLECDDKSLEAALRRIADEQFAQAIEASEDEDRAEAIHEIRRHCKRLRGLIRLVRTGFAGFEAEDAAIRDIAKPLSGLRDARVMLDTFEKLSGQRHDKSTRRLLGKLRERLEEERVELLDHVDAAALVEQARRALAKARSRSRKWKLEGDGWEVAGEGVAITYDNARAAAAEAFAERQPEVFHRLRKHVRYHWCHVRLLGELWPEGMGARAALADELADVLGYHHDLWVFVERLKADPQGFGLGDRAAAVLGLAHRRNAELEGSSETLTGRLLAETTTALGEHWRALWVNWRHGELPLSPPA